MALALHLQKIKYLTRLKKLGLIGKVQPDLKFPEVKVSSIRQPETKQER